MTKVQSDQRRLTILGVGLLISIIGLLLPNAALAWAGGAMVCLAMANVRLVLFRAGRVVLRFERKAGQP